MRKEKMKRLVPQKKLKNNKEKNENKKNYNDNKDNF